MHLGAVLHSIIKWGIFSDISGYFYYAIHRAEASGAVILNKIVAGREAVILLPAAFVLELSVLFVAR